MKKIAKLVVSLLFWVCVGATVATAEGIDGLWGGLTQLNDTILKDGDQWGYYIEDSVCYLAFRFDGEWVYLGEKPVGVVKPSREPGVYSTSDRLFDFTLKGEKLFIERKPRFETFALKKIKEVKPKELTMAEFLEKAKKYDEK